MPSTIQILIIDDNPVDRDLFRRLLEQGGESASFECVEVEHGKAGIEQFRRIRPGCVLLDLNLPDIDGLELLRALLREPDPSPVIVATAYGSEEVAVEAMKSGAADYVVKGAVSAEGLAHVIGNALEKRALQRQVEEQRQALEERNLQLEKALDRERAARGAVEQSEARYRTLAEAIPQLVWSAGSPGGAWDYVNERWQRLTGAVAESAFGRGWLDFIDPEDRARVTAAWDAAIAGPSLLELQCRIRTAAGPPRWQLMRALPLYQNGRPAKWIGTFTDIENEKRNEQLLHQRQKLESIGILAGGVAHDFNNLLVGIIGGVSYALEVLDHDHELRPILDGAFRAAERAAQLTRQMLAYAGKGSVHIQDVDLGGALQATWDLIQASLARSVELKCFIPRDLPPIRTDSSQLQQILMNLIMNASEAMPAGREGLVLLRAAFERVEKARSAWSGDLNPGDYVVMEVRDNGSGIDPSVLGKIFDPFFSTKFTGRGLGLAAVHGIVRSNKGLIEVESTPGSGAVFRVWLPAGSAVAAPAQPEVRAAAAAAPRGHILVVDDEPVVCGTTRTVLERAGHTVEIASGGRQALASLSDAPSRFSLVLLDLNMPGLDGGQTFHEIRRIAPDLPVVICSGYSDSEVRSRFENTNVNGFLQKPFRSRELVDKVSDVLGAG